MELTRPPLVTIGLPVYNGERYLDDAMASLLAQDYESLEVVVSDNASNDRTPDILETWQAKDPRVSVYRNPANLGGAPNFNRVLSLAKGSYFRWAGHDDLIAPTMVRACVEALEQAGPSFVLAYPQTVVIDEEGAEVEILSGQLDLREPDPVDRLRRVIREVRLANMIFGLIRTEAVREVGGLPKYNSGDLVMIAGLALRGRFMELPQPLFYRRIHQGMSWQASRSAEGFAKWFDPTRRWFIVFPMWRLWRELLAEVMRSDLDRRDKARAFLVVLIEWPRRQRLRMAKEILRVPRVLGRRLLIRA